jgi:YesN/AraC family two-component response regulator
MMSTLLRIWNDTSERYEGLFGDGFHPIQLLSECRTLGEMQEQIRVIYRTICEAVLSTQKAPGAMLVEQIAIYIERHYTENTLSLNSISQEFNLTPQYLSAVFKKHHGQNLADYMARIRIEKAKPLLEEGRMTLNEIANHVGYANDAGFIRVFKKYVGVTPGKYRGNFGRKA